MSYARYDIKMNVTPREDVRLLYVSKSRYGGDWHSVPHTHACSELFYCISGRGQFQIEGVMYNVVPDDLIVVNPLVEHTEMSMNDNPLEYIVLGIEGIEFLFNEKNCGYAMHSCADVRQEMLFLLQSMLREIDVRDDGYEIVCQDLLEVLLIRLMRGKSIEMRQASNKPTNKECAVVRRYIEENFTENITLDKLAEISHINKYYLAHAFQKEYNISPINYLIRRRILESCKLLESTDHSLSQISSMMGFSSASYFSQSFRRLEGISPTEYRKKARRARAEQ